MEQGIDSHFPTISGELIMTKRLLAVLVAGTLIIAPAMAHAQLNSSFGIGGGLAVPVSDLRDITDAGYNLEGHLSLGAPLIPLGVRLEVGYNGFNVKSSILSGGTVRILSGTVNGTVALGPTGASPYLIGGVGAYNRSSSGSGASSDKTVGGVNVGGGLRFPLGLLSTFIEARYHVLLGNQQDGTNLQYIPITFGINF